MNTNELLHKTENQTIAFYASRQQKPVTTKEICDAFAALLPQHKVELAIFHNEHKTVYETAADWVRDDDGSECSTRWPSDEAKQRAIATNEVWHMWWYPDTPVGSHHIAAPTLHELLEFAQGFK